MSALVSHLKELGEIEAVAYQQRGCFDAAVQFARCEGIVPAPEATHAVKDATEEALRCKREGKAETILFNLSGHGHFDMAAYIDYFSGKLQDVTYDEATWQGRWPICRRSPHEAKGLAHCASPSRSARI
jgi:tryptophan synthase beta chain